MLKIIALGVVAWQLLGADADPKQQFAKYRAVEAYEVRPGIVMMPSYTSDDRICEIGLQRLLYSQNLIRLDAGLSRREIDEILDELVPADARGKRSGSPADGLVTVSGRSMVTSVDYDNVLIQIYGETVSGGHKKTTTTNEVVATVKWKKRSCRQPVLSAP